MANLALCKALKFAKFINIVKYEDLLRLLQLREHRDFSHWCYHVNCAPFRSFQLFSVLHANKVCVFFSCSFELYSLTRTTTVQLNEKTSVCLNGRLFFARRADLSSSKHTTKTCHTCSSHFSVRLAQGFGISSIFKHNPDWCCCSCNWNSDRTFRKYINI